MLAVRLVEPKWIRHRPSSLIRPLFHNWHLVPSVLVMRHRPGKPRGARFSDFGPPCSCSFNQFRVAPTTQGGEIFRASSSKRRSRPVRKSEFTFPGSDNSCRLLLMLMSARSLSCSMERAIIRFVAAPVWSSKTGDHFNIDRLRTARFSNVSSQIPRSISIMPSSSKLGRRSYGTSTIGVIFSGPSSGPSSIYSMISVMAAVGGKNLGGKNPPRKFHLLLLSFLCCFSG